MENIKKLDTLIRFIYEEYSRQYRWQVKQKILGKCVTCGKKRNLSKTHCDTHLVKRQEALRKKI